MATKKSKKARKNTRTQGRRFGSISKRTLADGTVVFDARYTIRTDPLTGEPERDGKAGFATREEADKYLAARQLELNDSSAKSEGNIRVLPLCLKWLESHKKNVEEATYNAYKDDINRYVSEYAGKRMAKKLTPTEVQNGVIDKMAEDGFAPSVIRRVAMFLRESFDYAEDQGWVMTGNPLRHRSIKLPPKGAVQKTKKQREAEAEAAKLLGEDVVKKAVRKEQALRNKWLITRPDKKGVALKPEAAEMLLDTIPVGGPTLDEDRFDYYVLFALEFETGLRPQELLALTWNDIDLERGLLDVSRALTKNAKQQSELPEDDNLKTDAARRALMLSDNAVALLKRLKVWQAKTNRRLGRGGDWNLMGFIFQHPYNGEHMQHAAVRKYFKARLRDAGLPTSVRLYDSRHTSATLLRKAGVELDEIKRRLGHTDIKTTDGNYNHVEPVEQEESKKAMETLAFGKKHLQDEDPQDPTPVVDLQQERAKRENAA